MDKYAHKARKPRQCKTSSGIQKRILGEKKALKAAQKIADREGKIMSAYFCNNGCNGWHVGTARRNIPGESIKVAPQEWFDNQAGS